MKDKGAYILREAMSCQLPEAQGRDGLGFYPHTSHPASGESSVFPFHPAQIFPTTSVAFSYLLRISFRAKVSSSSLKKGQKE